MTDAAEARLLIKQVLKDEFGDGGILHTSVNLAVIQRLDNYMKIQCDVGGSIHNLLVSKHKEKDDNIRGVAKMMLNKGDKLLPEKFDNEARTGVLFRHWSSEMKQYLNVVDKDMLVLMNIAEKEIDTKLEGNTLKNKIKQYVEDQIGLDDANSDKDKFFVTEFGKRYDGNQDNMINHIIQVLNEQLHTFLMVSLSGEAKEMARIATLNGIEAWRSLNFRWNRKSQFGATQVSEMIGRMSPAKTPDEVYQKLNQLERLHLELSKHLGEDEVDGVKVKVHYGEAFKKADVLRVVNEEFNAQLKREGQELEKMSYQALVDKVQVYVRLNSKGKANMDIGMVNLTEEAEEITKEAEEAKDAEADDWWPDQNYVGYMGFKGGGKDKGKGKGFDGKGKGKGKLQARFTGACFSCGKEGHRAADCRSQHKGGGKGSSLYGGGYKGGDGFKGYGKGYGGKGQANNFEDMFATRPQAIGGGNAHEAYGYPPLMNVQGRYDEWGHQMFHLEHNEKDKDLKGDDSKGEDLKGEDLKGEDLKGEDLKGDAKGKKAKENDHMLYDWIVAAMKPKELKESFASENRFKAIEAENLEDFAVFEVCEGVKSVGKAKKNVAPKKKTKKITAKERCEVNLFEHSAQREPENVLNNLEEGWEQISILIDSGSTETVAPEGILKGYELVSTDWSESGKGYSAANGSEIPNLGEKVVRGQTMNGMWCSMKFQVCSVTKPLGSVSRMCQAGSRVIFCPPEEGSYIEHVATKRKTFLRQSKGLYFLDMWIAPASVFTRPDNQ